MKQRINLRAACVNDDGLPEKYLLKRRVKDRFILNADFYKLRQLSLQKQTLSRTIYTLPVLLPSCPPALLSPCLHRSEVPPRSGQRYCLARGRGTVSFGTGVPPRSGQRCCLASSEANNSLRAGRATRFGRGEQLASGGASNSLRARRTEIRRKHDFI